MDEETIFYTPSRAAEVLSVGRSTLRRWAHLFERAIGPLPRDERGGRLWTKEALALLAEAKKRASQERISMEEALKSLKDQAQDLELPRPPEDLGQEVLGALERLVERLEAVEAELRALREENAGLKRALKALEEPKERKPWWRFWA